ncbi:amidohydrolase family protein [Actinoplanes sp. Pm04-4]|uniref:Amidohydrolase family protein n=1 Tax=Paractinoplanes pyxinae TaxID=2997416 RepID=A0ABT4B571_9ACTN|nr:amidohydrolase family protein [Actinoplanes pyxinae]MCY1141631.1 amidohydrolase family protein [Actinoplanes pyxinae]
MTPRFPSFPLGRRTLLKAGLPTGLAAAGVLTGPAAGAATVNTSSPYRVDVHCHHIPDFYRAALTSHGVLTAGGVPIPAWSPTLAVNFMDRYGIQTQVVSISEPGVTFLNSAADRRDLAAEINDYTSKTLVHTTDTVTAKRFGGFAVLPLGDLGPTDIRNAGREARRAITELKLDGIGIFSNYEGVYLGDPRLDLLMAVLNDLGAMVFVHPVTPVQYPDLKLPTFLYEFPFDTTRAAVNMLYRRVYTRFPKIRWLLAHAGGALPYLSYRTSMLTLYPVIAQNLGITAFDDANVQYAKLFYDTALSPVAAAMKSVREVTPDSHILFATDWPFSSAVFAVPGDPAPQLSDTFTAAQRLQVERTNALAQFPLLAARLAG